MIDNCKIRDIIKIDICSESTIIINKQNLISMEQAVKDIWKILAAHFLYGNHIVRKDNENVRNKYSILHNATLFN